MRIPMQRHALALCTAALLGLSLTACGGKAPNPPAFAQKLTLQDAVNEAAKNGKPVLVFATADWCGPCQSFKRGALASERVTKAIAAKTVPVLLDVTNAQTAPPGTERLGIQSIPVLIMYKNGAEVARLEGGAGEAEVVAWIDAAAK